MPSELEQSALVSQRAWSSSSEATWQVACSASGPAQNAPGPAHWLASLQGSPMSRCGSQLPRVMHPPSTSTLQGSSASQKSPSQQPRLAPGSQAWEGARQATAVQLPPWQASPEKQSRSLSQAGSSSEEQAASNVLKSRTPAR